MFSITKILLLATTATAALVPRTYSSAQSNLTALENNADAVTRQANALTGSTNADVEPVYAAEGFLNTNFTAAIDDLNNYPLTFTSAESTTFLNNLGSIFFPKLRAALNAVIAKKRNFEANDSRLLQTIILRAVSTKATSYGSAFVTKVPAAQRASATAVSASFSSLVASALAAYSAAPAS